MTTLAIFAALGKLWPFLLAGLGAVGVLVWGRKKEAVGAAKERARQAQAEAKARDIADQVDNDVGALTPEQIRAELDRWAKD